MTDVARRIFEDNRREYGNGLQKFEPNDLNKAMMLDLTVIERKTTNKITDLYKKFRDTALDKSPDNSLLAELNDIFETECHQR